jgi:hypothetical protein
MSVRTDNGPLRSVTFWLVSAYGVLVGGFAGWRGKEFWTWQNISLVVLPPAVVAFGLALRDWWRNPHVRITVVGLVLLPLIAGVTVGGMGLILAWVVTEWTGRWAEPAARAAAGAALAAAGFGLTLAAYGLRRPAGPGETSGPEGTGGPG